MIFTFQYDDTTHTVSLERQPNGTFAAAVDGRSVTVEAVQLSDGVWLLTLDGARRVKVYTAADGHAAQWVSRGGAVYRLVNADGAPRKRSTKGRSEDRLVAKMPGQVVEVAVSVGDRVVQGQTLVVLEAMKMEIRVTAPHDGRVAHVFVRAGDVVERDQQLLDLQQEIDKDA